MRNRLAEFVRTQVRRLAREIVGKVGHRDASIDRVALFIKRQAFFRIRFQRVSRNIGYLENLFPIDPNGVLLDAHGRGERRQILEMFFRRTLQSPPKWRGRLVPV